MAWSWNRSGRIDSFEFEKVDNQNINISLGKLECLITGGTLTYSYYSDLKVSGQLNVINAPANMAEESYLIRIWYVPKLDGEIKRIELGTFYFTANLHYENGQYSGTLDLRSMLARHVDDATIQKWTLGKNTMASDGYLSVFKSLGGFPVIDGIRDVKLSKAIVFKAGVKPMEILQYCADLVGGEITVSSHGETVLRNYRTPAEKANDVLAKIYADENSVVSSGFDISNSWSEIPNRCVFEQDGTLGIATLAADEPRSFENIGKYITHYENASNVKSPVKTNLQKLAATTLRELNSNTVYYEFTTYFQPIDIGQVIEFKYDNTSVIGLVSDIDLNLAIGLPMRVKIRRV